MGHNSAPGSPDTDIVELRPGGGLGLTAEAHARREGQLDWLAGLAPFHFRVAASIAPIRTGLNGVIDALSGEQHMLEMYRRTLPDGPGRKQLNRLSNRLTKIIREATRIGLG